MLNSLANFLAEAMSLKVSIQSTYKEGVLPGLVSRTPSWFMSSSFASASAFAAFDRIVEPAYSLPRSAPLVVWQEECDGEVHENFTGRFPLIVDDSVESWPLQSLSHLDFVQSVGQSNTPGSSSGIRADSAYIAVRTPSKHFSVSSLT